MCNFCFIQISAEISPNMSKTTNFNLSEYILKTDAVLNYLPGSSHAKFVESHEHPKALIVLYGLAYFFYKSRSLKRGVRTVQTIQYKVKSDTKIGMYPAMPFIVMCFKEGILQSRFKDCVRPYDRSFSKIGEIEI